MHGGSAPQVKNKARLRLLAAAEPAVVELIKIAIERKDVADADRIRAIKEILDRVEPAIQRLEGPDGGAPEFRIVIEKP